MLGERVQVGVGGGVVGLPGRAGDTGDRGEEDEGGRFQAEFTGEFVQQQGRVRLRPQDRVEAVRGEVLQHAVVEHPRCVHDPTQGVRGGDAGEQTGDGIAVGGVAGDECHLGTQLGEVREQFRRTRGRRPAPPGEQQVPDAVMGDEPLGDAGAQRPGGSGQQPCARLIRAGDRSGRGRRVRAL